MLKDIHLAHLTGTATIHEIGFFSEVLEFNQPRRTIGQMFFKPYESKQEFIFCTKNTLGPSLLIGICVANPITAAFIPALFLAASLGCLCVSGVYKCLSNEESATWWLNMAEELFSKLCQIVINILVAPIALLVLITRSISTGLKAADICDYDAPKEDMPQAQALG